MTLGLYTVEIPEDPTPDELAEALRHADHNARVCLQESKVWASIADGLRPKVES